MKRKTIYSESMRQWIRRSATNLANLIDWFGVDTIQRNGATKLFKQALRSAERETRSIGELQLSYRLYCQAESLS